MLLSVPCHRLQSVLSATLKPSLREDTMVQHISTDTRTIAYGDTFVALHGENFDGHDYVELAIEKGANAVIVERELPDLQVPQLIVADTRLALRDLAKFQRAHFAGKVIAITGSNGKTTTKEMLKSILSIGYEVSATKGNLNNDLGVPFTVFDWTENDAFAIVEMGANHTGEIAYLSQMVSPDIAVITNVSAAHVEGFGSVASIAEAKAEIYDGLSVNKGIAVINLDDAFSEQWLEKTQDLRQVCFARQPTSHMRKHLPNVVIKQADHKGYCEIEFDNGEVIEVALPIHGLHNIDNALAAATVTYALGIDADVIAQGLAMFEPVMGRLRRETLFNSVITVIDDTYNANPASLRAAIEVLQAETQTTRVLVLGDMGELGKNADEVHYELGEELAKNVDVIFGVGELTKHFVRGAQHVCTEKKIVHLADKNNLVKALVNYLTTVKVPTTVLVKGSRCAKMEQVVQILKDTFSNAHSEV